MNHHGVNYYACTRNKRSHVDRPWYDTHPAMIMVREERLLPHLQNLFADQVFGPDRSFHLADHLTTGPSEAQQQERVEEQARLSRTVEELSIRQRRR